MTSQFLQQLRLTFCTRSTLQSETWQSAKEGIFSSETVRRRTPVLFYKQEELEAISLPEVGKEL